MKLNDGQPINGSRGGVMVALYPDARVAQEIAITDGAGVVHPDDLHVTLAFLGFVKGADTDGVPEVEPEDKDRLINAVRAWAGQQSPITVTLAGIGVFTNRRPVTYASIDGPDLEHARHSLTTELSQAGLYAVPRFTPHITLAYADRRDTTLPSSEMTFNHVVVAFDGDIVSIPLGGKADVSSKAFVTTVAGRTTVSAPARTVKSSLDLDDIADRSMLWIDGRFVGADRPNHNGAMWSSGDLEMAQGTVAHGPLNWLHEMHYIIGSIASARFVRNGLQAASLGDIAQPHISVTAAIWRWIWPDEAFVVENASDLGRMWLSMECISRQVECAGAAGCGNRTSYQQYLAGVGCPHIRERSGVRRFVDPIFLGGAIIVPPARPGWAEADARVIREAQGLAEAAFEQAGSPDISATEWEQMMTQIVSLAMAR